MNDEPSHPIENLLQRHKSNAGVRSFETKKVIYKGRSGWKGKVETSLELEYENYQGQNMVRLRTIHRQGLSIASSGYTWTVRDPANPKDLMVILEKVFAATMPHAPVIDTRSWLGRLIDRIIKRQQVNELPQLAEQTAPYHQTLSARIVDTSDGRWVSLIYDRGRGLPKLYQSLPMEALQALHTHLSGSTHA